MLDAAIKAADENNFELALEKYNAVVQQNPGHAVARRSLARIYSQLGHIDESIEQWLQVAKLRPDIKESWLRLGRLYKEKEQFKLAIDAYHKFQEIDPGHPEPAKVLPRLELALKHQSAEAPGFTFQHVAIVGVSYCGSTLLASILGGLPGVENIGESHWLINRKEGARSMAADFENDDYQKLSHCFSCGSECKIFTRDFRAELQADPVNWYYQIAERLHCKTLVSADKNYVKLTEQDPLLRLDAIVLFKSPIQAWYSNYKKIDLPDSTMSPITDLEVYMQKWRSAYDSFLDQFDNRGDKIFLSFDAFCEEPEYHLRRLSMMLELKFNPVILEQAASGQHCFGGNSGVNRSLRSREYQFSIDKLPKPALPPEHIEAIHNNPGITQTYDRLIHHYRCDFAIVDPKMV